MCIRDSIRAKKLKYYNDKNFTGRVLSPPKLSPVKGDYPKPIPCEWGYKTRPVDDRLYPTGDSEPTEFGGSQSSSELKQELFNQSKDKEQLKENDLIKDPREEQDIITSIKLGQFERQTSPLVRAHEFSRGSEPEMGM